MRDHIQIILSFKLTKKGNQAFYATLYTSFPILYQFELLMFNLSGCAHISKPLWTYVKCGLTLA